MINLEYLICQYQATDISLAIKSHRNRNQNPAFEIIDEGDSFIWRFTGLQMGLEEEMEDDVRVNHMDFYIGMDDLASQIDEFPNTTANPVGLVDGLRVPINSIRPGGKPINWIGPVTRVEVSDISINIPPYRLRENTNDQIILNIDREFSRYPITSGANQTIREIHFGIEHNFDVSRAGTIRIPRIEFTLSENEYSEVLEALRNSVEFHLNL
ncbi:MAG: hypothetical protein FJW56_02835 [Actinobacteria bacterium]|nr:hypothetical protein [Actinomycetota bacterium]